MRYRRVALLAVGLHAASCTRTDLHPITEDSQAGGGGSAEQGGAGAFLGGGGALSSSACGRPALPAGDSRQTLSVDGVSRSYILHLPAGYQGRSAVPLLVDFHGIGESGASERRTSPYPAALDAEGIVMAFPDGLRGPAGTGWNVGPCCVAGVDDVAFARALVAHVQTVACIEPTRVYAVGVLTGGGMAHYLACHAADLFAGVGTAAFDLLQENVAECVPVRPVSVVSFRSTEDPRVPYEGGESSLVPGMPLTFLGAKATFAQWGAINQCAEVAEPLAARGCLTYPGCAGGAEVVLCTREGQDQQSEPEVVWNVLRKHAL